LTLLLAVCGLSVSGGLIAFIVMAVTLCWPGGRVGRRGITVMLLGVMVNAPWWVAGLLHAGDSTSGRAAVEAFAAHAEGHLPAPLAVLSLGGVWNTDVIPASRTTWFAVAMSLAVIALAVVGFVVSWRAARATTGILLALAVIGYVLAMMSVVAPAVVGALTSHVPGAAAFRDGTRFLALLAVPEAVFAGLGAGKIVRWFRGGLTRPVMLACLVALPLATTPDLAWGVAGDLRPVDYPAAWSKARATMEAAGPNGRVLVWPPSAYRAPAWNHDRPLVDPAPRYFTGEMVAGDALYVGGRLIDNNDSTARAAKRAMLAQDFPRLRSLGIGYVLVERDAASGLRTRWLGAPLFESTDLAVYRLDRPADVHPSIWSLAALVAAWCAAFGTVALALVTLVRRRGW
jgi:hypothetical protein